MTTTELVLFALIVCCVLAAYVLDYIILKYWNDGKKFPCKEERDGWL